MHGHEWARSAGTFCIGDRTFLPVCKALHNEEPLRAQDYVVRTLVLKYKLVGGRYERDHSRLDCTATSRFIVDTYYDQLIAR